MSYEFTPGMAEITGFGGSYEHTARMMLRAGMTWLDAHPSLARSPVSWWRDRISDDNRTLEEVLLGASGGVAERARIEAVRSACAFIQRYGWPRYVAALELRAEQNRNGERVNGKVKKKAGRR